MPSLPSLFAVLALALVGCRSSSAPRPDGAPPQGHLGHPLGTFLRIEGVRETRGKVGDSVLLVDRVNGTALAPPQLIWIDNLSLPLEQCCRLAGYESGRWVGLPDDVRHAEGLAMQQGMWQFHVYFIATSAQEPAALTAQLPPRPR